MSRFCRMLVAVLTVALSGPVMAEPRVFAVSPSYFKPGTVVTVSGRGFAADITVNIGSTAIHHIRLENRVGVMPLVPVKCRNGTHCIGGRWQYFRFKVPKSAKPGRQLLTVETFEGRSSGLWVTVLAK